LPDEPGDTERNQCREDHEEAVDGVQVCEIPAQVDTICREDEQTPLVRDPLPGEHVVGIEGDARPCLGAGLADRAKLALGQAVRGFRWESICLFVQHKQVRRDAEPRCLTPRPLDRRDPLAHGRRHDFLQQRSLGAGREGFDRTLGARAGKEDRKEQCHEGHAGQCEAELATELHDADEFLPLLRIGNLGRERFADRFESPPHEVVEEDQLNQPTRARRCDHHRAREESELIRADPHGQRDDDATGQPEPHARHKDTTREVDDIHERVTHVLGRGATLAQSVETDHDSCVPEAVHDVHGDDENQKKNADNPSEAGPLIRRQAQERNQVTTHQQDREHRGRRRDRHHAAAELGACGQVLELRSLAHAALPTAGAGSADR